MRRLTSSSALFVILAREVRWRTEIPKWLSVQMVFVILTHEVRWRREIPKRLSVQTVSVILTCEVRWHSGVPYGYPHLSSTRGKRARWRAETNIVFCTFCHPETASPVTCGEYLMVIRTFRQSRQTSSTVLGWCWSSDSDYSQKFCRFLLLSSGDIQAWRRTRFFFAGWGWSSSMAWGNVMVVPLYRF